MLTITNYKIYDLKESVIACRNAMRVAPPQYTDEEFEASMPRAIKLVQASKKSDVKCHDNLLTGIRVSFDVTFPQYWTPQAQRYHWFDIVSSASKMHRLTKMDADKCCNKYVDWDSIETLDKWIKRYNICNEATSFNPLTFTLRNNEKVYLETKEDALYFFFMKCISNCPCGFELFMRASTNYKQLQTIYFQRRHHKLHEDWGAFCEMIESLPFAHQLIIGDKTTIDSAEFNREMAKL